ncbi:MAG: hypothetical protein ABSH56_23505 [Bryobacteraceae bacterium]|jgi:hypothetical protein
MSTVADTTSPALLLLSNARSINSTGLRRRVNSIRRGLGIHSTAELTKYALEHGISGS